MSKSVELKKCPFCGGNASLTEYGAVHEGDGVFTTSYKCGCSECGIFFNRKSRFYMEGTEVKFLENGYEYVTDHWNNRAGE